MADRIAGSDDASDSLQNRTGPWGGGTGDNSRHFNCNRGGVDSRLAHSSDDMNAAIALWRNGLHDEALDRLGRGLHSIQDYEAHRQWDPSIPYLPDWNWHPPWYDDVTDPRNRIALQNTQAVTIQYVTRFRDAIQSSSGRRQ